MPAFDLSSLLLRIPLVNGKLGVRKIPINTSAPTMTGTPNVGQTLTGHHGTYTRTPANYTYRWFRDGVAIGGATALTYVPVLADMETTVAFGEKPTDTGAVETVSAGAAIVPLDSFSTDFETFPFTSWLGVDGTLSQVTANRPGSAGTHALRLTDTGSILYPCAWHHDTQVKRGGWYQLDAWECKRTAPGSCGTDVRVSNVDNAMLATFGGAWTVDTWKRVTTTFHAPNANTVSVHFSTPTTAQNQYADLDDLAFTPLTLADLLTNATTMTATVTATVRIVNPIDTTALGIHGQAGVFCNLDNASTPQNLVLAYLDWADDGTANKVKIEKCVNGVWSVVLAATAVTYANGGDLQLRRSGNVYSAYYNGTLVGSATITDASIVSNTLHGSFKTHANITLSDFALVDGQGAIKFDKRALVDADDGRWHEGNSSFTASGQLIFGYNDATTKQSNSFMRFTSVTIPAGVTITVARLDLLSTFAGAQDTVKLKICSVKAIAPAAPTSFAEAESPAAGRTTAVISWTPVAHWADATWYSTADFAAVIQELIGQASWAGAAAVIYVEDDGSTATNFTMRKAQTTAAGIASAPNLHIEYTP